MAYLLKRIEDMKGGEDVVAFAAHVVRWKSTAPGYFVLDGEATYAVVPAPEPQPIVGIPASIAKEWAHPANDHWDTPAPSKEPGPSPCDFSPCVGQKCRISCDKCMTIIKHVRELDEKGWDGVMEPAPQPNYPSYLDKPAPVTTNRPDGDLNPAYHLDGMEDQPAPQSPTCPGDGEPCVTNPPGQCQSCPLLPNEPRPAPAPVPPDTRRENGARGGGVCGGGCM